MNNKYLHWKIYEQQVFALEDILTTSICIGRYMNNKYLHWKIYEQHVFALEDI